VRGALRDISAGGLCLQSDRPLKQSQVVLCDLPIPGLPVAIPTLMNVRWVRQSPEAQEYTIGLQFLF